MDGSTSSVIQVVQIQPDRLCVYNEFNGNYSKRGKNPLSRANLSGEKYRGNLSKVAKKSLENKINSWAATINIARGKRLTNSLGNKNRLIMITVTLPTLQMHSDKKIKRECLNRLLITLKRKWGCERYLWKAEFQGNDNIHFHIIVDKFVPHADLRGIWNNILTGLGYIDEFEKKHHHRNPNTTDIHQIHHLTLSVKYMKKYMSKEDCCRLEGGAIWGCSDNLKALKSPTFPIDNQISKMISEVIDSGKVRVIKGEECTLIFGAIAQFIEARYSQIYRDYRFELEETWRFAHTQAHAITQSCAPVPVASGLKVSRIGSRGSNHQLKLPWW